MSHAGSVEGKIDAWQFVEPQLNFLLLHVLMNAKQMYREIVL